MAHALDEVAPGEFAFVSAREDAWHRLGTVLDHTFTAEEAMTAAHLGGWNVRKVPLTLTEVTENGVTSMDVPDRWATVRTNPISGDTEYMGTVGSFYTPIQNEEHTELIDALVDESGAHLETAGSLRGGRETFVTMKMPETMQVGGQDGVDLYVAALNSHDGSTAFRFMVTPVRIVCANTQLAAIKSAKSTFSVRHTGGARGELQQAREALGLTFKYVEAFEAEAEKLIAQTITDRKFKSIVDGLFEVKTATSKTIADKRAKKAADVFTLYKEADTMDGIRGTKWGAYQAVTEYIDHYAPTLGTDGATARATRTLTSHSAHILKEAAWLQVTR